MEATQAQTPCNQQSFAFQDLGQRKVIADFSGGYLSSDGGSLLLREVDRNRSFTRELAKCFTDTRFAPLVEHKLEHLLAQRIHGICLGYEDLNDHDKLCLDPLLALTCDKEDLLGEQRAEENQGKALSRKSTLNRLELGSNGLTKTKKIQPPLHPHLPQRPSPQPKLLLRPRRHGKSDQRTTNGHVRRPHLHQSDGQQPASRAMTGHFAIGE